jgi:chorismate--pyruvate lyase
MHKFFSPPPWRPEPSPSLLAIQKRWLTRPGPLTQALRTLGPLNLRVLAEYPDGASTDEAHLLALPLGNPVWVREIVMDIEGVDCVVARSVTPLKASHGIWQGMRRLRSRPLADILYGNPAITRSSFEVARLNQRAPLSRTVERVTTIHRPAQPLLARRSVFWRQNTPLLVTECFLPNFWARVR